VSADAAVSLARRPPQRGVEGIVVPRVRVHGVAKRWERRPPVFEDVWLDFQGGTLIAMTGQNGAGKTTFLRLVAGLIDPDDGTITLDGLHPRRNRREYSQRIGYLSAAQGGLYARLSVAGHLDFSARLALLGKAEREAAAAAALDAFGLGELADRRVDRLSMGQRQRIRLAIAFLHRPRVVLLDEPWNSLDEQGIAVLRTQLATFVAGGGLAICCAPTGSGIAEEADEVYVVGEGRIGRL
jgi:ABC-2 type transport system ATP-binding protein